MAGASNKSVPEMAIDPPVTFFLKLTVPKSAQKVD